ncbi:class I adenylate-forming enzyme family protein [Alloalcanivorax marinus]|uniref:class I adenylate-forming enzyme family protein n=1 Tax=Alloalcanivorax marinus TaxID=1177169 RepID=UPI0019323638|nr:long-chain fatty acid--CoA ligase [Alloalcanivorax marinus]MBL7249912.1 long-chain fatty acid--CoA ligase [Alloalcanivorax marinus]
MYLTQGLHRAVQQFPERTAVIDDGLRRDYRTLADRCARLAGALAEAGLKPGDRVAILALNGATHWDYFAGLWWGGFVANPVNTRWSLKEMAYSLADSGARVLLVDDEFLERVPELRQRCPALERIIHVGSEPTPPGLIPYEPWLAAAQAVSDRRADGEELAVILYTGGTTGFPKGVMLSHSNLWSSAVGRLAETEVPSPFVTLMAVPLFHTAGLGKLVSQLIVGGTSVVLPGFRVEKALAAIAREKVTDVILVPSMIQMMVDDPGFAAHDLSALQTVTYGASPMSLPLLERAMAALPGARFMQSYGMTEAAPVITVNPWWNHQGEALRNGRVKSAGRAGWGLEVRIVDESGTELPRGEIGEVIARGDNIMLGYWNQPAQTAEVLRDGWLHTGDGGYMDEGGYIYIVDRLKDMIVSGGENVYCAEVENRLARHPAVVSCAVIGVPHAQWGESVHAVVVLREGARASEAELCDFCRQELAGYKCPRSVEYRDQMPLSGAGKILKNVLREPYWRGRDRRVS